MKILDLKKVTIILVTMLLFLSMQISVFASDNCTVVKIPVKQLFDSEVESVADEFSYIMTTDQSDAPMPAGSRNKQYSWTMEKNAATEITLNVKTAGQYHYTLCQTTEKKDNYKYDQNKYHVTVEAYYNESNQLKVVTIVANEKGEKIETISFKNSYMGEEKPNPTQPSNPLQPSRPSHSDGSGKTNSVKTGDDSPVMGYFLLLFGSLICLSILTYENQKRNTFSQENGWSIFSIKHVVQVDKYDTLQDAVMAAKDSSETADLNAYVSDAKAVLMSDTKTTVNTEDSTSPEPSDAQDPCDEYVNLTINKVWKDFRNMDNIRPDTITVTISRSWTDAEGTEHTEVVPNYENYEIKGDISKSTWQKVIETLPAYIKDDAGTLRYYKYSVTETEINGYTTTIKSSDDGFTFTIINRHFALLPDTGGEGIMMFIIAGGLLLAFLLYTGRRRKRKQTM